MKYLLLSLLVVIGIVSCQKEITDEVPSGVDTTIVVTPTGKLEADIDSVRWVANTSVKAYYSGADTSGTPPTLLITAVSSNGRTLNIGIIDSLVRTHVYDIYAIDTAIVNGVNYADSTSATKGSFSSIDSVFAIGIKVGTVSITVADTANKTISGNFSFKVGRSSDTSFRNFTNGTFTNVPYTKTGGYIPTPGTDSFHVKINDTLFTAYNVGVASVGNVTVSGWDSLNKKNVSLLFADTIYPGSYSFGNTPPRAQYFVDSTHIYSPTASSGILQILENNSVSKRVRGNFSFVGRRTGSTTDSARLTEGYFSVELP